MDGDKSPRLTEPDFLRLFVKNEEALRAFARVLLSDWEAVDEVLQESSIVIWRKLNQLDGAEGFLPWAKVIVRFEAMKYRRTVTRERNVFSEALMRLLADEAEQPSEEILQQQRDALRLCVSKLDPGSRELVMMPYAGHGTVARLAERSGRTANSLYKQIARIRDSLMRCVERQVVKENLE